MEHLLPLSAVGSAILLIFRRASSGNSSCITAQSHPYSVLQSLFHLPTPTQTHWLSFSWGIFGLLAMLGFAVYRLSLVSIEALGMDLLWYHWLILLANGLFMAYSEGYRGFQKAFSPRATSRALWLARHGSLKDKLLAPAFIMSYFGAPRRRVLVAWVLTALIIALVIAFRFLPQPIRGILDAGVVVGLSWGIAATLWSAWLTLQADDYLTDPQVSTPTTQETKKAV